MRLLLATLILCVGCNAAPVQTAPPPVPPPIQGSGQTPAPPAAQPNAAASGPISVTDPGIKLACSADPTGASDSTCAIEAVIAYDLANPVGSALRPVYLPAGTYKISAAIYVPVNLRIYGDGKTATIIEQTNPTANTITAVPEKSPQQPNSWMSDGSISNMTLFSPLQHLYKGTFLELDDATGYHINNVELSDGGGRGLQTGGYTERLTSYDLSVNAVRWPIISLGNESRFYSTNINAPGEDGYGYCWSRNCVNGTFANPKAAVHAVIMPDNRVGAFYISGAAVLLMGGSIKSTWNEAGIETQAVFSSLISDYYIEGYPINGQPHENAALLMNGQAPWTTTTGPLTNGLIPVQSTDWFPNYINNPADIAAYHLGGGEYRILPSDYLAKSALPSIVPGLQRGQFENVMGVFSGDGAFHIQSRNWTGSTAPANTNWPTGSVIAQVQQGNYSTLKVEDSHLESIDAPGKGWTTGCNDATNPCAEAIIGTIPNGYTDDIHPSAAVQFDLDGFWGVCSQNEVTGEGCIKVSKAGSVEEIGFPNGTTANVIALPGATMTAAASAWTVTH